MTNPVQRMNFRCASTANVTLALFIWDLAIVLCPPCEALIRLIPSETVSDSRNDFSRPRLALVVNRKSEIGRRSGSFSSGLPIKSQADDFARLAAAIDVDVGENRRRKGFGTLVEPGDAAHGEVGNKTLHYRKSVTPATAREPPRRSLPLA